MGFPLFGFGITFLFTRILHSSWVYFLFPPANSPTGFKHLLNEDKKFSFFPVLKFMYLAFVSLLLLLLVMALNFACSVFSSEIRPPSFENR